MRKISVIFTGGGTAGHVTPNLALIPILKSKFSNLDIHYIGSEDGIEKEILAKYGAPTAEALVESAMGHVHMLEECGFDDIVQIEH